MRTRWSCSSVMIAASSKTTSEFHTLDARDASATPELFAARTDGVEYSLEHAVIGGVDRFFGPAVEHGILADRERQPAAQLLERSRIVDRVHGRLGGPLLGLAQAPVGEPNQHQCHRDCAGPEPIER